MEEPANSLTPESAEPESVRRGVWQWVGAVVGFVLAATIVGGLLFKVPYVALVPGSARDTEPLLEVEGIESFPSDGELLFTTVRVRQRPNLWEYLWLRADKDTEIVAEDVILAGRSRQENRDFNLQLMTDSKSIAIAVALEELGYDAIRSDGVVIIELVEGGAAEAVLELGDTVVAIDDAVVDTTGDLVEILAGYEPGDEIVLTVEPIDPDVEREIPAEAIPTTTAPPTTAPTTTALPTTAPTTTSPATAEPGSDDGDDAEGGGDGSGAGDDTDPSTVVVMEGQTLWNLAETILAERLGSTPTEPETTRFWADLIALNRDRLPTPDLIHPGQILELPVSPAATRSSPTSSTSEEGDQPGSDVGAVETVPPAGESSETTAGSDPRSDERVDGNLDRDAEASGALRIAVVLGAKPDEPDAAFLGVGPTDRVQLTDGFDFLVDIDSGSVGGPSAGLAFTLAVLDELTVGELTGGATVAVTGTIDVGGRVGAVGGVVQKTAAVRDLGADAFLVPADLPEAELARVMDRAGDDLEIIPVEDLDDALEALAGLGGEVAAVEEFAASNLS